MKVAEFNQVLSSPVVSAAAAADSSTGRLVQIAVALDCALKEAASPDAERQLHKLLWLLCKRSGGDICRPADSSKPGCNKTHRCVCGQAGDRTAPA